MRHYQGWMLGLLAAFGLVGFVLSLMSHILVLDYPAGLPFSRSSSTIGPA